jgi:hypothetical protein
MFKIEKAKKTCSFAKECTVDCKVTAGEECRIIKAKMAAHTA